MNSRSYRLIVTALLLLLVNGFAQAQFWKKTNSLLPEEEAFIVTASVTADNKLAVSWSIADDYYMYREQFSVLPSDSSLTLGGIEFPQGQIEDDPEFGEVEVYFFNATLEMQASLVEQPATTEAVKLIVKGQGCNKPIGVCYPPLIRTIEIDGLEQLEALKAAVSPSNQSTAKVSTSNASSEPTGFFSLVISAFFAGILLSFTPCVLPMIPILAGVIAGEKAITNLRAGWLATCYVMGTVVTYIAAGTLAGATGAQLQAYFQNAWVLSAISLILVVLALSLFGLFRIEVPGSLQAKLHSISSGSTSAAVSSFVLGLISALVVGACVSPILIVVLGAAISQGDPLLGASIMGSMAVGMGLLLIAFGFGAGWILPRSGPWMSQIQKLFGFMVLGVAIYLLDGIAASPTLYLWAALLLVAGFYVLQIAAQTDRPLTLSFLKALSFASLIWGAMALIGASQGGKDILRPLDKVIGTSQNQTGPSVTSTMPFKVVTDLDDVKQLQQDALSLAKPVLIDFYADWCLDCKRMDRGTFAQSKVQNAVRDWQLIKIDVTDTSAKSEEVKRYFEVFGPPATLFFHSNGAEAQQLRQYGYIETARFLELVEQVN